MVTKKERYTISAIANFFISTFFWMLYFHVSKVEPFYSIGLIILSLAFTIKAIADLMYAFLPHVRPKFHRYTSIHYLLVGLTLLLFPYFGYTYSTFFAILALIFAYYEFQHVRQLEDETYRFKRHLVASIFRAFMGAFIFFDSLFYNVVNPTAFGYLITIYGTLIGLYIMYSALTTYRYVKETSTITIWEALGFTKL